MSAALPSWRTGETRTAILEFVDAVTADGTRDYVPPADRVAVLDNDGTLWCERPAYAQALFLLDRLRQQAAHDPELAQRPVMQALLAGDFKTAVGRGMDDLMEVLLGTHAGLTAEEFSAVAEGWLEDARHPRFGVRFGELIYAPMLELLELLRANRFRVFIVTGGGVEFVRAISERIYGISPDHVIGSAVQVAVDRRDGRLVLVRQAKLFGSPNEGAPKVVNIQSHIGQRPIFAAGNSAGDREMLEYVHTGSRRSLCLVVDHDDPAREYAYTGVSVTDPQAEPILETARTQGWTVASIRNDWCEVFPASSVARPG